MALAYLLPVLVWGAAIVLQLASPVVPFMDVLFNHVAPVEHVRIFGSFETLTASPSPNFGPSRTLFGYVAIQSTIAVMVQLPAALAIAAFALPLTILFALAVHRLADTLFGQGTGFWSLITVPLTFVFLRIPDARATALVFPLVAWSLVLLVAPPPGTRRQRQLLVMAPLAAGLYVHPFIAGLMVLTIALLALIWPLRYARVGWPAAGRRPRPGEPAGGGDAGHRGAGMDWRRCHSAGRGRAPGRRSLRDPARAGGPGRAHRSRPPPSSSWRRTSRASPPRRCETLPSSFRCSRSAPWSEPSPSDDARRAGASSPTGIGVAILVMVVARLLPAEGSLVQSLQGEAQPKALAYWAPFLLALAAAAACHAAVASRREFGLAHVAVALYVYVAILPMRLSPTTVNLDNYEEHRMAESVSIALHHAQLGYWVGYPDSRTIVNAAQQQILDRLAADRAERARSVAGRSCSTRPTASGPGSGRRSPSSAASTSRPPPTIPSAASTPRADGSTASSEFATLLQGDYDYVLLEGDALVAQLGRRRRGRRLRLDPRQRAGRALPPRIAGAP